MIDFVVYVLRRLLRVALSLVAVSLITFVLLQLVPGSYSELANSGSTALGDSDVSSTGQTAQRHQVPAWLEYLGFIRGAVTLNMGPSYRFPQETVQGLVAHAFPVSLSLAIPATVLTLLIAIPIGMIAAVKKDKPADRVPIFVLTALHALPGYLFALFLVLILAVLLGVLPVRGWEGPKNMIIPVLALAVQPTALLARYVRTSMLEILREEYVVAAYAKGGSRREVLIRQVLRNSLIPVVTVAGPLFASLATGTVFIEVLLGIPGLGRLFTTAARTRDMPLLMGTTLFFAFFLMMINLVIDLLYGLLDPRIRQQTRNRRVFRFRRSDGASAHRPLDANAADGPAADRVQETGMVET